MAASGDTPFADPATIARVLTRSELWFVVGLSNNRERAAYGVAEVLREHGKAVVPIHPDGPIVEGVQGFPTIAEAAALFGPPDVVDLFVRSDLVGPLVDQAVAAEAAAVWLQLGVIDEAAAARAQDAGLDVVMDRCPAIELPKLLA